MHRGTLANHYIKADGNVIFDIEKNPFGLTLYGRRNGEADSHYWRITQWLFPWFTLIPPFGNHALGGHVWVPIDDENCWAWSINFHPDKPLSSEEREAMAAGKGIHVRYEQGEHAIAWRPMANRDNDYLIDRKAQKERRAFSGVLGFSEQDASLQESMGVLQDRTQELLLPTDKAIVMARRMLEDAARGVEKGEQPPALDAKAQQVRAAGVLLPIGIDPKPWAKDKIQQVAGKPVYSI